jgi:prolipoprotein diacylglyceryltransferase
MLNGFERFWIEKIRVNTNYNILGGITQAEIISIILFLLGLIGLIYFKKVNLKARTN